MKIYFHSIQLLRLFFYPIINYVLPIFSQKIKNRLSFEMKNNFHKKFDRADIAFEVSSEGELEQIRPILDFLLKKDQKIELIFASHSVEKKCLQLSEQYHNLDILRLPIVTYGRQNIKHWMTAPILILCRYDFFPELMLYGMKEDVRFVLLAASIKNKPQNSFNQKKYDLFDLLICSTNLEYKNFLKLNISETKLMVADFRVSRILERIDSGPMKLEKFNFWNGFDKFITKIDRSKRVIIGSAWPCEIELLQNRDFFSDKLIVIAPHKLDSASVNNLIYMVKEARYRVRTIQEDDQFPSDLEPDTVLFILIPGILCEMYQKFGIAIVGGGFHASVHSLMEPFLSGCFVVSGPNVHRSTEYDYILDKNPHQIKLISDVTGLDSFGYDAVCTFFDSKKELDIGNRNIENVVQRILNQ